MKVVQNYQKGEQLLWLISYRVNGSSILYIRH